jgi:hypothetical protein
MKSSFVMPSASQTSVHRGIIESVHSNVVSGDSLRIAGVVATRDGQVVVADPIVFIRAQGGLVVARTVTTEEAAGAMGGVLDATYVRVVGTIEDTTRVGGDFRAIVNDSSSAGPVTVVLDQEVLDDFDTTEWAVGAAANVRGLLVPESGQWVLKPRSSSDVSQP